jgi:signal transduction histidine kinase/CheY-like chemotaxis protein
MITIHEPDMDKFRVNEEFERVLGWSSKDAQATDLMAACYPDPDYREDAMAFMQAPGTGWKNFKLRSKDGDDVFCSWTNIRLSDDTQVGIGIDRTDQRQLEAQLRQSQKMETVGTLAGGVAHDFNNILHAVLVYVQLTTAELSAEHSAQTYLGRATGGIERAKKLTEQLLAFSRKGRPEESETFNVEATVRETVDLLQPTLSPEVELVRRIDDGCIIEGNPDQIQQVVMNLLTNAHQAMAGDSGGVLEVELRLVDVGPDIAARHFRLDSGTYVRIMISDTGTGIDPDDREHIFEPFFTTKRNGEGSGLGLSVVHGIVRSHEGEITLYSEVGEGTTFHVYLPAAKEKAGGAASAPPDIEADEKHILFVDDDAEIVEIESIRLRRLGYSVTTCTDGQDALEVINERHQDFDLVITDYAMPRCNGIELARRVKVKNIDLPVVLISGFSAQLSRQDIEGADVHAYVKKPIFAGELKRVLATL